MSKPIESGNPAAAALELIHEGNRINSLVPVHPTHNMIVVPQARVLLVPESGRFFTVRDERLQIVRQGNHRVEILEAAYVPGIDGEAPTGRFDSKLRHTWRGAWTTIDKSTEPEQVASRIRDVYNVIWSNYPKQYNRYLEEIIENPQ